MVGNEALLIIDMSNDFVHDKGNLTVGVKGQEIVPEVLTLADSFIQEGNEVVVCMDAHKEGDSHFELWPAHNVTGTWGQELFGDLNGWYEQHKTNSNVHYVPKPEYDAFFNTNLEEILRSRGIETVHLTGVCTDICDFLTAYGAYARGFKTVAHRKGMATFTENHEIFLEQMKSIFKTEIR